MRLNWKPLTAAFLAGALLGVLCGAWIHKRAVHRRANRGPDQQRFMAKLTRELDLDANQQEAVRRMIEKYRADTTALEQETSAKFDNLRMRSRAGISKLLRPEQAPKFQALTTRWDELRKKRADGRRPYR